MQLSIIFAIASAALAHGSCDEGEKHLSHKRHDFKHDFKKPCLFCPGACACPSKDKYPHGIKPEHCENVYEDVHIKTGCQTEFDVKTLQETRTQVINHLETATNVLHPEETYTLTRTESYVVWPAQTSFAKEHCHKGCGKPSCHGSC